MTDNPANTNRPVRVYLDQADWSYLQDGRFPEAEKNIRRYAEEGRLLLLISNEHLIETAELSNGLRKRIDYIRNFPNTYLIRNSSANVLKQSAASLVQFALDDSCRFTLSISMKPLKDFSLEDLVDTIPREFGIIHGLRSFSSRMTKLSRSARPEKMSKADLIRDERFISAMLRGDKATCKQHISDIHEGKATPFQQLVTDTSLEAGRQLGTLLDRIGCRTVMDKTMDPVFHACVMPHLDSEVRNNKEQLRQIFEIYQDQKAFARKSPPLAMRCAVYRAIHYNSLYRYKPSDETDQQHILFAVFADVFTCDKRNVSMLLDVLKTAVTIDISIVRTGQLDGVVQAIFKKGIGVDES